MENNFVAKFELIDQLSNINNLHYLGLPTGLLTHAILNTIELSQLVYYYLEKKSANTAISRNILKRLPDYEGKTVIYDLIFEELKRSSYVNRLRFRKLMDVIIEALDETRRQEYFTFFSNSDYRLEIKAAIKMAGTIWSEELSERFLEKYYCTGDPDVLEVLITNLKHDQFKLFVERIWTAELPNYFKPKLIARVKGWLLSDLEFVKKADPGNFITLVRLANENIEDTILIDCYNRIPDAYRPFALWHFGRMGKWELIKKPIEKFIEDPEATFTGFSNTMFD